MNIDLEGIRIPDSKLAREIMELVRDTEPPLLFHHSSRVYYWGALAGKRRGLRQASGRGETGRRKGLKIPRPSAIRVRLPSSAPRLRQGGATAPGRGASSAAFKKKAAWRAFAGRRSSPDRSAPRRRKIAAIACARHRRSRPD